MEYEQKELNNASVILKGCHLKEGEKNGVGWSIMKIFTDQEDYSIWLKKKDGTETKAFTQLKAMGFPVNKRTGVSYSVKDGSYLNKHTGKRVEKEDRTIMWFENLQEEERETLQEEAERLKGEANSEESGKYSNEKTSSDNEPHDEIDVSDIPFN